MRFGLEIKRTAPEAARELCQAIRDAGDEDDTGYQDGVLISSFAQGSMDAFRRACPEVATSATRGEVRTFYILHRLRLNGLVAPPYDALQVPEHSGGFRIVGARFVRDAAAWGLQVIPWTIDDSQASTVTYEGSFSFIPAVEKWLTRFLLVVYHRLLVGRRNDRWGIDGSRHPGRALVVTSRNGEASSCALSAMPICGESPPPIGRRTKRMDASWGGQLKLASGAALSFIVMLAGCSQTSSSESSITTSIPLDVDVNTVASSDSFGSPTASLQQHEVSRSPLTRSPVELALGFETDPNELSALYDRTYADYLEALEMCVAAEGFEYEPPRLNELTVDDFVDISVLDQLREFGYGATLNARSQMMGIGPAAEVDGQVEVDPLVDYVESMDADERTNFFRIVSVCEAQAEKKHPNVAARQLPIEIADEVHDLRIAAEQSTEVQTAWSQWSACMAEDGFDVTDRQEARELANEWLAPAFEFVEPLMNSGAVVDEETVEEFEALIAPLAAREQLLVESDARCATEYDLEGTIRVAVFEAEDKWLEENGDRIALILAEQRG